MVNYKIKRRIYDIFQVGQCETELYTKMCFFNPTQEEIKENCENAPFLRTLYQTILN